MMRYADAIARTRDVYSQDALLMLRGYERERCARLYDAVDVMKDRAKHVDFDADVYARFTMLRCLLRAAFRLMLMPTLFSLMPFRCLLL